ncbi:Paraplegin [Orchesella cincta]|uniref:Paraplegin n=1 Tax=Orchesella cincta TaxID=48709 RepID=A0A1D2NHF4_ORCCI|nr:Paraplegin [Orchesella cincta]
MDEGVLVLSSTNRADVLDKASAQTWSDSIRHILIDAFPTLDERKKYLNNILRESTVKIATTNKCVTGGDLEYVVERLLVELKKGRKVIECRRKEDCRKQIRFLVRFVTCERPETLFERMCMALVVRRVAESLTFNKVTTVSTKRPGESHKNGLCTDKSTRISWHIMDEEARRLVFRAYLKMAQELLAKETLNYDDVEAILGPPPYGSKNLIGPDEFEVNVNEQAGVPKSTPPTEPVDMGSASESEESKRASIKNMM